VSFAGAVVEDVGDAFAVSAVWTDRSLPLRKYWHSISTPRSRSTILYLTLTDGFAVVGAIEG
jgi:hypothetical protein